MLTRRIHDTRYFRLGDLKGKYTTLPDTLLVNAHHDLPGFFLILVEHVLQNHHHKFHGRIVVIEQQNSVLAGPLCLCPGSGRQTRLVIILVIMPVVIVSHAHRH